MKKLQKFALLGAIALAGSVSFSSCSSDDDPAIGPDGEQAAVKTQFAINIPKGASTRQAETTTQANNNFYGIESLFLVPFNAVEGSSPKIVSESPSSQTISLTAFASLDKVNQTAYLYEDVQIPVGTKGFLFYGKATTTYTDKGETTMTGLSANQTAVLSNEGAITFTPKQIAADFNQTIGKNIAKYLQNIANAMNIWSNKADVYGDIYKSFTKTGLRGGSSKNTTASVNALYQAITNMTDNTVTAVKTAITDGGESGIKAVVNNENNTITGLQTTSEEIIDYPGTSSGLPDGAAVLNVRAGDTSADPAEDAIVFEVPSSEAVYESNGGYTANSSTNTGLNVAPPSRFVKPAELWYFVNTDIKTADASKASLYTSITDWTTLLTNYTGDVVTSSTQSVALTNVIQYGMGLLKVYAKYTSLTLNTSGTNDDNKTVTFANSTENPFEIKGILIGGQKAVDYKFNTVTSANEYTIYDANIASASLSDSYPSTPNNYTLVYETEKNVKQYIAVELENTSGKDFEGANQQIIPAGAKFYLVGVLDPSADTTDENDTTNGTVKDTANNDNKVFKQDFTTTVNLNISSVKNAYNVIPDLRSNKLELGLSVNLQWQAGTTYEVNFN